MAKTIKEFLLEEKYSKLKRDKTKLNILSITELNIFNAKKLLRLSKI